MVDPPGFTVTGIGPVRRITLNRPDRRNAQTVAMWHALDRAAEQLAQDREVRCVVLSGAGATFSAGIDLAELGETGTLTRIAATPSIAAGVEPGAEVLLGAAQRAFLWPTRAPFLVIAAVEGVAIGAGMELALACDVRIVADTARMRLPEMAMGVVPDLGGCHLLRHLVGYERALDLIVHPGGSPAATPSTLVWRYATNPPARWSRPRSPMPTRPPPCRAAPSAMPRRHWPSPRRRPASRWRPGACSPGCELDQLSPVDRLGRLHADRQAGVARVPGLTRRWWAQPPR